MTYKLKDDEIARLIQELKPLPSDYLRRLQLQPKKLNHKEAQLDVRGAMGSEFRIIARQALQNPLDFSMILAWRDRSSSNQWFRLRRYNGKHGVHTNKIEGDSFYDFHIHQATRRYQRSGWREDAYAEPTDRFHDVRTALECLIADCGFELPPDERLPLFDQEGSE